MRKKFFILAVLFYQLVISVVLAQDSSIIDEPNNRLFLEFQGGNSHLLHPIIDENFNNTFNFGAKVNIELPNRVISIAPIVNFKQFSHQEELSNSEEMLLTIFKTGIQFNYRLYESKNYKLQMYNFLELNYTWMAYDFRYEDNSSFKPEGVPNTEILEIMSGKSAAIMLGYRIKYHFIFMEFAYDIYGSNFVLSNDAKEELDSQNIQYDNQIDYGVNSFNFNIGVSIPLRTL